MRNKWTDITIYLFAAECSHKRLAFAIDGIHNTGALWGEAVGRYAGTCSQRAPFYPFYFMQ